MMAVPPKRQSTTSGCCCRMDVESWGALAERIHAEIDRGQKVVVQGRLKVNSWTDMSGTKKKSVRVRA